jgi:aminomethyltransferase
MVERRTPLYDIHLRSAREMVRGGGDYMFPTSYTSPVEEHLNVRRNLGMQDLSSMGEVDVQGPGAERLIRRLLVNDVADMEPGQVRYSTMCNEGGGIVDDVTVYKFDDEHFMIVTSSAPRLKTARWIREHAVGTGAYATDVSGAVALLTIQGPRSRSYLKSVAQDIDLDALKFFRFSAARLAGVDLLLSRSGYTGELGYELYVPAEQAAALWEHVAQSGRAFNLQPYGTAAMHSLRIEKAFPLYGVDIDEDCTPFHAGLDRWIAFNKRDFIGRDALLRVQEQGLDRRWAGLILQSDVPAAAGDAVYSVGDVASFREKMFSGPEAGEYRDSMLPSERAIGRITCSARGHSVGHMLAMAYLDTAHLWPGHAVMVGINGRLIPARVAPTPFFDPQNARLRARARDDEPAPRVEAASPAPAPGDGAPTARLTARAKK